MGDRSNIGGGLGLVAAVAVVSTGIILASFHLHRRLGTDPKTDITEQGRQRKKKVRFADEVMVPNPLSLLREEYRRRRRAAANGPIRPALRKA
ncbi:hypothetical protein CFC21_064001 [Triticum aestivum]|uniref:Uncharacterized protein n=3 Tax=Triticum TaxID=4564 RepID=A0A9R1H1H5_WHEAT|nr:hypothetical protein CFC21_063999 [Triticum aestivum]KAF7056612.1 hypothetical protein CFC21_064001 [Triticum aestivum]